MHLIGNMQSVDLRQHQDAMGMSATLFLSGHGYASLAHALANPGSIAGDRRQRRHLRSLELSHALSARWCLS
jgi:hypothetical protein